MDQEKARQPEDHTIKTSAEPEASRTLQEAGSPRIAIFVVAYNAVTTLTQVLDRIPQGVRQQIEEVYVFDDASSDDTYLVGRGYKEVTGWDKLKIFRNEANLGYGGNQKQGYHYAIQQGFDIVVLLHGDGQYAPEVMSDLLEPLIEGRADAVFGSRMIQKGGARKGGMPLYKLWGNRVLTSYQNRLTGANLSEWHSGYRAYRVEALKALALHQNTNDFHFDTEIILQLLDQGFRIEEVPIPVYYGDEVCYVNGMRYAKDVVRTVWDYKLHRIGSRIDPRFVIPKQRYRLKSGRHSSHSVIAASVPYGSRVLDLGCEPEIAQGFVSRGCEVVGVNLSTRPGHECLARLYECDLEKPLEFDEPQEPFDVVVAADIVEHLRNGDRLLCQARDLLKPGGLLAASVANVAFVQTRLSLLTGRFDYGWRGILDEDHVRFYTKKTFMRAVRSAGFEITKVVSIPAPLEALSPDKEGRLWHRALSLLLLGLARIWPGMFAFQFVIRARPVKRPGFSGECAL